MINKKIINKNNRSDTTRKFLLSFFSSEEKYDEKEVNGYFLVKQFSNFMWSVAVFTRDSFMKRQKHKKDFSSTFRKKTRGNSKSEYK